MNLPSGPCEWGGGAHCGIVSKLHVYTDNVPPKERNHDFGNTKVQQLQQLIIGQDLQDTR